MLAQIAGEAASRDNADTRADFLNAAHERIREEQRPEQIDTEQTSRLRIRRDAARIVVGCAGDETRSAPRDERAPALAAISGRVEVRECSRLPRREYRSSDPDPPRDD